MRWLMVMCGLVLLSGCARYEYDLVRPPALAGRVGTESDKTFTLEQMTYRLRSVDNYLVMRIENGTDETLQFLGGQSYVVSPNGQSHPFRSQAIAPRSFMKLIFPPMRPQIAPSGPSIGFGVGARVSRDDSTQPKYLQIYLDDGDPMYWEWNGETDVRIRLTYQRGEDVFAHEFVFHRRKT